MFRERTNNPKVMPSSPLNKSKRQKKNVVLPFPVQQSQKNYSLLPRCLSPVLSPTGGSFVSRHGCARFLLARLGVGEASCKRVESGRRCPAHCASSRGGLLKSSLEESELDVDMSNWQNFRRLGFLPVFRGDTVSQVHG